MESTQAAVATCDVPVFFATTEGQTRRIAEYIAAVLRDQGIASRAIAVTAPEAAHVDWSRVRAVAIGASLHGGTHQEDAAAFVRTHAGALNARPSVFFSVSLSAASTHADERAAARQLADAFPSANGWTPSCVACFAGRLAYTQYGFITRMVLKRIAHKEGAPTDTSRDYELTDWHVVDRLCTQLVTMVRAVTHDERMARAGEYLRCVCADTQGTRSLDTHDAEPTAGHLVTATRGTHHDENDRPAA